MKKIASIGTLVVFLLTQTPVVVYGQQNDQDNPVLSEEHTDVIVEQEENLVEKEHDTEEDQKIEQEGADPNEGQIAPQEEVEQAQDDGGDADTKEEVFVEDPAESAEGENLIENQPEAQEHEQKQNVTDEDAKADEEQITMDETQNIPADGSQSRDAHRNKDETEAVAETSDSDTTPPQVVDVVMTRTSQNHLADQQLYIFFDEEIDQNVSPENYNFQVGVTDGGLYVGSFYPRSVSYITEPKEYYNPITDRNVVVDPAYGVLLEFKNYYGEDDDIIPYVKDARYRVYFGQKSFTDTTGNAFENDFVDVTKDFRDYTVDEVVITYPSATATYGVSSEPTKLEIKPEYQAVCRYSDTADVPHFQKEGEFISSRLGTFASKDSITKGAPGVYSYYVSCQDRMGNFSEEDAVITYTIIDPLRIVELQTSAIGQGSSSDFTVYPLETSKITLQVKADTIGTCKYTANASYDYADFYFMNSFGSGSFDPGFHWYSAEIQTSELQPDTVYTYYVFCRRQADYGYTTTPRNSISFMLSDAAKGPEITFNAFTKEADNDEIDLSFYVTDYSGITTENVFIDEATTVDYYSNFSCEANSQYTLFCIVTIETSGDLYVRATNVNGVTTVATETDFVINDTIAPVISFGNSYEIRDSQYYVDVITERNAICSYAFEPGVEFDSMNPVGYRGDGYVRVHGLGVYADADGTKTIYFRCQDTSGNINTSDFMVFLEDLETIKTEVYRFYSKKNKAHFYTSSEAERDAVIAKYSDYEWKYEGGEVWYVLETQQTGSEPVYRFWSKKNGAHFYTASDEEKKAMERNYSDYEWKYEDVVWYK
jgi:hypothetical protein